MVSHQFKSITVVAQCEVPFTKRNEITGVWESFPCGKCYVCKMRRISGWSFRLRKHERISQCAHFVTLTYNTDHVPITKKGYMSLCKADCQKFFKRLRKYRQHYRSEKITYYLAGEYGGKTMRPHYHIILYNSHPDDVIRAWSYSNIPIGDVHIGTVSAASIGYTLKYICKDGKIPMHKNDDRIPEFSLMSKGLGACYLSDQMIDWHKRDLVNRFYCPIEEGKKIALPRYYKKKMYTDDELQEIAMHMQVIIQDEVNKDVENYGENYEKRRVELYEHNQRKIKGQRIAEKL